MNTKEITESKKVRSEVKNMYGMLERCKRCNKIGCECPYTHCECGNPIYVTMKVMCNSCIQYERKLEQETYNQVSSYFVLFHYYHDTMLQATSGLTYPEMESVMQTIDWECLGLTMPSRGRMISESTYEAMRQQKEYHG